MSDEKDPFRPLRPGEKLMMSSDVYDAVSLKSLEGKPFILGLDGSGVPIQRSDYLPSGTVLRMPNNHWEFLTPFLLDVAPMQPVGYKRAVCIAYEPITEMTGAQMLAHAQALLKRVKKAHAEKKLIYLRRCAQERGYLSYRLKKRIKRMESELL